MSEITIEITKPPYIVADKSITSLTVKSLGFMAQITVLDKTGSGVMNDSEQKVFQLHERIKAQVTANSNAGAVPLDDLAIMSLPAQYALKLNRALDEATVDGEKPGKVASDKADGMFEPILYDLGTPFTGADGKKVIALEFQAKTMGDMEKLLVAANRTEQMEAMLSIAKPIMDGDGNLLALPSWMYAQLTMSDGVAIYRTVLTSFLQSPNQS